MIDNREYGYIQIRLNALMVQNEISKNKLCQDAEIGRTQLNRLCRGETSRLDLFVLARLCTVLHCDVGDILKFVSVNKLYSDKY